MNTDKIRREAEGYANDIADPDQDTALHITACNAYIAGATRDAWLDCDIQEPDEHQDCSFVVISNDDDYNGRILGGRYQGKKRYGYEFSTPGHGWNAKLWQPLPPPPST